MRRRTPLDDALDDAFLEPVFFLWRLLRKKVAFWSLGLLFIQGFSAWRPSSSFLPCSLHKRPARHEARRLLHTHTLKARKFFRRPSFLPCARRPLAPGGRTLFLPATTTTRTTTTRPPSGRGEGGTLLTEQPSKEGVAGRHHHDDDPTTTTPATTTTRTTTARALFKDRPSH